MVTTQEYVRFNVRTRRPVRTIAPRMFADAIVVGANRLDESIGSAYRWVPTSYVRALQRQLDLPGMNPATPTPCDRGAAREGEAAR